MLKKAQASQGAQWSAVDQLIDRWLHERQELILLMCAVDGLKEYTPKETPVSIKIQAFCQVLIDYVSHGHFAVYDELMEEEEQFGGEGLELAHSLYPKIQAITEIALQFNDKYDTHEHCEKQLASLPKDLSYLAERLEERFQMEDQLISVLHTRHKEMVA